MTRRNCTAAEDEELLVGSRHPSLDSTMSRREQSNPSSPTRHNFDTSKELPPPIASLDKTTNIRSVSRNTAYDGLRGLACLVVFNFHFLFPYSRTITYGYSGSVDAEIWGRIHQLPIICLLIRGRAMVTLFFTISGYALSQSFLATLDNGQRSQALLHMSSTALRRWFRLFLPATISMLMVMIAAYLGAFEAGRVFQSSKWLTGAPEQHPPNHPNFMAQWEDYAKMWWHWSNPTEWRLFYSDYDPHTWTVPVEFRGSIAVFVLLLMSAKLKSLWRSTLTVIVFFSFLAYGRWDIAAFIGGAFVAQASLWHNENEFEEPIRTKYTTLVEKTLHLPAASVWTSKLPNLSLQPKYYKAGLLLASLFLLSFPDDDAWNTPGFAWLYTTTPMLYKTDPHLRPFMFWHTIAAILVIWSVQSNHAVQRYLSSPIARYLGRISYSLYLVHGPLLHSAGFALQMRVLELVSPETTALWLLCLISGWVVLLSTVILVAHVYWRVVEMSLVRAVKQFEDLVSKTS